MDNNFRFADEDALVGLRVQYYVHLCSQAVIMQRLRAGFRFFAFPLEIPETGIFLPFSGSGAIQRRSCTPRRTTKHPPIVRYTNAYEAVHALAVGFVYIHGLAPDGGDGHRVKVIGTLLDHLRTGLDLDDRSEIELAMRQRHAKIYESPAPPPSVRAVDDLIARVGNVEGRVKQRFPAWYAMTL